MKKLYFVIPIIFTLSACKFDHAVEVSKTDKNPNPCYEISHGQFMRTDIFLIDKCKGRVWQQMGYDYRKGEPLVWDEMVIIDSDEENNIGMRMKYDRFDKIFPIKENQ